MKKKQLRLFEAVGIELEYMIVDGRTMEVRPVADELIRGETGDPEVEPSIGPISWSNELTAHVIEFKTDEPARSMRGLAGEFQRSVERANGHGARVGATLLGGAMHPWMDPMRQTRLWPYGYNEVYKKYDQIFSCKGHGWANLQSMHLNLPFDGDEEFGRLHAAIRLVLPILPALAASSPIMDGRMTGLMDSRLEVYRHNSAKIPSMAGEVIPEQVFTEADYRREIFERIWRDLEPYDAEGMLRHEWANSRGAIARFDRGSIEIRVIDVQECPAADLAIAGVVIGVLRELVERGRGKEGTEQREFEVARLKEIFLRCIRDADRAVIDDAEYLRVFGVGERPGGKPRTAGELWKWIAERSGREVPRELAVILDRGCLARRMLGRVSSAGARGAGPGGTGTPDRQEILSLAREMAMCLSAGRQLS